MKHGIVRHFILIFLITLASESRALTMCLYARSTSDITSGHSFVTLVDEGQILETYGFWPGKDRKGSMEINKELDNPKHLVLARWELVEPVKFRKLIEEHICQDIGNYPVKNIREWVVSYKARVGRYRKLGNNCTHFAVRLYNAVTGDTFRVVQSPLRVRKIIRKIHASGARSYSEWAQLRGVRP